LSDLTKNILSHGREENAENMIRVIYVHDLCLLLKKGGVTRWMVEDMEMVVPVAEIRLSVVVES